MYIFLNMDPDRQLQTTIYDIRDDFSFPIVNFLFFGIYKHTL